MPGYNKYFDTYFVNCTLVRKKFSDTFSSARTATNKTKPGGRVRLNKRRRPDDIYVFILPKEERDHKGDRVYGALYPDGATVIWPIAWARKGTVLIEDDEDREKCAQFQKRLRTKPKSPLLKRYEEIENSVSAAKFRASLDKKPKKKTKVKRKVRLKTRLHR